MRSPIAADIAPRLLGVEADCAGLGADADVPLDPDRIAWADVIAVMERSHLSRLKRLFGPGSRGKRLVCLDVPDRYGVHDPDLVALPARRFSRLAPGAGGRSEATETG